MKTALEAYLSNKKIYQFRGKSYYKLHDYKETYYIETDIFAHLDKGSQEVSLERNSQYSSRSAKGMIKWDPLQQKILLSRSKVRLYYKPFDVE
jgi:hypothetical protein